MIFLQYANYGLVAMETQNNRLAHRLWLLRTKNLDSASNFTSGTTLKPFAGCRTNKSASDPGLIIFCHYLYQMPKERIYLFKRISDSWNFNPNVPKGLICHHPLVLSNFNPLVDMPRWRLKYIFENSSHQTLWFLFRVDIFKGCRNILVDGRADSQTKKQTRRKQYIPFR